MMLLLVVRVLSFGAASLALSAAPKQRAVLKRAERAHILGEGVADHQQTTLQKISERADATALESSLVPGAREALLAKIKEVDAELGPPLSLIDRLTVSKGSVTVAAEFKRASPSKGKLAQGEASAGDAAGNYAEAGAALVSILTEPEWFQGSLDDLLDARRRVNTYSERPAMLRKDFLTREHMILEARAFGADTVLLIVACLEVTQLEELITQCREQQMEPLVEVHTEEEMLIALEAGSKVIGINNRNLHTFKLDMETTPRLAKLARGWEKEAGSSASCILSLSGVASSEDVETLVAGDYGVACVLVGETLMRSPNAKESIAELLDYSGSGGGSLSKRRSLAKVCGVTSVEDALAAASAGADLIGVIAVPKSKRAVDAATAAAIVKAIRSYGEREGPWAPALDQGNNLADWAQKLRRDTSRGRPLVVGVVQDQPLEEVRSFVEESGVDLVQLHGDESLDYATSIAELGIPHLRVLHADVASSDGGGDPEAAAASIAGQCEALCCAKGCCGVLIDAAKAGARGGVGEPFDWRVAELLISRHSIEPLVAGGLGPEDVAKAKLTLGTRVLGFDASSKLESGPRVKDHDVLRAYVTAVRTAPSS